MAKTKSPDPQDPTAEKKAGVPKTVRDAKEREVSPGYWHLTDDEVLLRSPEPDDLYRTSDSWRVFRIMGEFVNGFDELA
ncbi:MAG: hypothetical protein AB7J13_04470, partial [Pyrinomonadaceae bacterium]